MVPLGLTHIHATGIGDVLLCLCKLKNIRDVLLCLCKLKNIKSGTQIDAIRLHHYNRIEFI